jgi:histidine triad (HIT) family protein
MYDDQNIFAKILRGEIPSKKLFENDIAIAFADIAPAAPVHILVVPKTKHVSFEDFMASASPAEVTAFFKAVREVAHIAKLEEDGYRLITNHGKNASQSVPHFHVHILGGRPLGGLLP